jgi:hypothetical protein
MESIYLRIPLFLPFDLLIFFNYGNDMGHFSNIASIWGGGEREFIFPTLIIKCCTHFQLKFFHGAQFFLNRRRSLSHSLVCRGRVLGFRWMPGRSQLNTALISKGKSNTMQRVYPISFLTYGLYLLRVLDLVPPREFQIR